MGTWRRLIEIEPKPHAVRPGGKIKVAGWGWEGVRFERRLEFEVQVATALFAVRLAGFKAETFLFSRVQRSKT